MLEALKQTLFDETFQVFMLCFALFGIGTFVALAIPYTAIAYWDPPVLAHYRIQKKKPTERLVVPCVVSALQNATAAAAFFTLLWPALKLSGFHYAPVALDLSPRTVLSVVAQVVFCLLLDDFIFYWVHKALHSNKFLYTWVHKKHHTFQTTYAIVGYYMTPVEFILEALIAISGPLLLGCSSNVFSIFLALRAWEAAEFHCGYEFPWTKVIHAFPFSDGPAFHDFHHSQFLGNYASLLTWTDKTFGTLSKGYPEYVHKRDAGKRAA